MTGGGDTDGGAPIRIPGSAPAWTTARRFYTAVTVGETDGQHRVLLDGRPVRTPARRILELPTAALAEAIAEEWRAQGATVDPRAMPLTRLVNSALDGVATRHREVVDDIARYAGSDLLCYRATHPEELVQRQCDAWDPLLAWAGQRIGAGFRTASGIVHIAQDDAVAAGFIGLLADLPALQLTALHVMTTLTGSAVLAYAHAAGRIDADTAWAAAHVDEDWQIAQWGEDAEAAERRRLRRIELQAASRIWALGG